MLSQIIEDTWSKPNITLTPLQKEIMEFITKKLFAELKVNRTANIDSIFLKSIAKDILMNSNTYDIILKFPDFRIIKCHSLILKNIGYFSYIYDYSSLTTSPFEFSIDLNYDDIFFVLDYLYTGNTNFEYLKENFFDLTILIDYLLVGFNTDTNITISENIFKDNISLFNKCSEQILTKAYDKYENKIFLENVYILCNMFPDTYWAQDKIYNWFFNNSDSFLEQQVLVQSQLFQKYFMKTAMYATIIIKNEIFELFTTLDKEYYQKIMGILFQKNTKQTYSIAKRIVKTYNIPLSWRTLNLLPVDIFKRTIYKLLHNDDKYNLIMTHKKYEYLDTLCGMTSLMIKNTIKRLGVDNVLASYCHKISGITYFYKETENMTINYDRFTVIKKFKPLSFNVYYKIGIVTKIINPEPKNIEIKTLIYIDYNMFVINKKTTLVFVNKYSDIIKTFKLKNMRPEGWDKDVSTFIVLAVNNEIIFALKPTEHTNLSNIVEGVSIFVKLAY